MDVQRRSVARSRRERPLDRSADGDGDGREQPHPDVRAALERQWHEQEAAKGEADEAREAQAFLDWAVPQLSQKRQAVIRLDLQAVPVEEIQQRLGVSRDVVYACRSRALKDLATLRDRYTP